MLRITQAFVLVVGLVVAACGEEPVPSVQPDVFDSGTDVMDTSSDMDPQQAILSVPETERWTLPGLRETVHVVRVEANIPHIYAENVHDLYLVEGFLLARDRYFEFELGRRLALGELSALLGDLALPTDQHSRGQGMSFALDRILAGLTPEQEEIFDAFAAGVNAYIEAVAAEELPPPSEITLAGSLLGASRPEDLMEPVDRRGALGFVGTIVFELGFEGDDVTRSLVSETLSSLFEGAPFESLRSAGVLIDIWRRNDPVFPINSAAGFGLETAEQDKALGVQHVVDSGRSTQLPRVSPPQLSREMLVGLDRRLSRFDRLLMRGDNGASFGSNAWAISGQATSDGSSILAGDGHLSLGIPPIFYQIGLDTSVFGGGDVTLMGLLFAGLPILGVGTNGRVAWSQTYLEGDITDWYAEQIQLDDRGLPSTSLFLGELRPLVAVEETYVVADVPLLGSDGREETWTRWMTFDGRWLAAIEGRSATLDEVLDEGESLINVQGELIVPGDTDDDGIISAISFDYTGFDVGDVLGAVMDFAEADSVQQFREQTRNLVAYAQNIVAADASGGVFYSGFNATPCRGYLARGDNGEWLDGANPTELIDGTTYGGFQIPLTPDRAIDYSLGQSDPYRCVIPFEEWPSALNPARGFVLTANNDPGNISHDGLLYDDAWYIGGPWAPGYRAMTISQALTAVVSQGDGSIEAMAALQADHRSRVGEQFVPFLLDTIAASRSLSESDGPYSEEDQRLVDLFESDSEAIEAAESRLSDWLQAGAQSASGVDTFYNQPTEADRRDAVATMIFATWFRAFMGLALDDEGMDAILGLDGRTTRMRTMTLLLDGRGPDNPEGLASFNPQAEESIFFDILETAPVETSTEVALMALTEALALLRSDPIVGGIGGFGTDDMDEWLWGMRHMVAFESLISGFVEDTPVIAFIANDFAITPEVLEIADDLEPGDPRLELPWFPRPGDWLAVDAANPSFTGDDYFYRHGPVMRMVIQLGPNGISGQNVIPGGQSGLNDSPHFTDQAALWLGNQALPLRFHPEDVVEGATGREVYVP